MKPPYEMTVEPIVTTILTGRIGTVARIYAGGYRYQITVYKSGRTATRDGQGIALLDAPKGLRRAADMLANAAR